MMQTKFQFNTEDNKREAIISYLIWNKLAIKNLYNIDISRLKNNIDLIKNSLYPKSLDELINCVKNLLANTDSNLPKMFNCLKWTKTKVDAKFVGTVMQRMGDLPQCALSGDLIDTANFVQQNKSYKSSQYIEKLTKVCGFLEEFPPILIYKSYNNRRKDKAKNIKYYIEDGNHRALAYILCGNTQFTAFIGSNKFLSIYRC